MAKKLDSREYEAELIKVLDGDTIDCYIDLGFDLKIKKRIRYMGIDTWESRTRDLEEKEKGLINNPDSNIDLSSDGWVSVNDILIEEGHAYDYHGGKKKDFKKEIKEEKENQEKSIKDI